MTFAMRCGVIAVACGLVFAGTAHASNADANMGGPSRAELFELRWKTDLGPTAATLGPKLMQPFFIPKHILSDAVYGIALSSHNDEGCACKAGESCSRCRIDWGRVAHNKIAFVFLKATHGARYRDPAFEYHWHTLAQQPMHRGARHFMTANEDPVEQANHFVERLEAAGNLLPWDLPPVLELERDLRGDAAKKWIVVAETGQQLDLWQGQDPDDIVGKILKWLNRVEQKTGRVPIIYTSRGWWMERIKDEKKFMLLRRYPLWIADYPETGRHAQDSPNVPNNQAWTIWQFTANGRMEEAGIVPGDVEVSVFRGTLARFRQAMKVAAIEAEVAHTGEKNAGGGQQIMVVNPPQEGRASDAKAAARATSATPVANAARAGQALLPLQKPDQASQDQTPWLPQQSEKGPSQAQKSEAAPAGSTSKVALDSCTPPQTTVQAAKTEAPLTPATQVESKQTATKEVEAKQALAIAQAAQPSGVVASQQPTAKAAPQTSANHQEQVAQPAKSAPQVSARGANARGNVAPEELAPEQLAKVTSREQTPPAAQVTAAHLNPAQEAASPNRGGAPPPIGGTKANTVGRQATTGSVAPSRTAQRNSAQRSSTEKTAENMPGDMATADKPAERIMIEIELPNGRKLRVDANIDPGLLQRLVNAIDK